MRAVHRFALVASLLGLGCGSSSPSTQPEARDQAAAAGCNYYMRCSMVGAGLKYETTDSCLTQVKAYFDSVWSPAQCKTISATGFNNCIAAINIATCGSGQDVVYALADKCTQANVCVAASAK